METAADDFLTKPLDFNLLKEKLKHLVNIWLRYSGWWEAIWVILKTKFRRKIRENVYEFVFAQNGEEALERVKRPGPGCYFNAIKYARYGWTHAA